MNARSTTRQDRRSELARKWDALGADQRHALLMTWTPFRHACWESVVAEIMHSRFARLSRAKQRGVIGLFLRQAS